MKSKRILSMVLSFALCLLTVFSVFADGVAAKNLTVDATVINFNNGDNGRIFTQISYSIGDINSDGYINSLDSANLSRYLSKGNEYVERNPCLADINCDGNISSFDTNTLKRILVGYPYELFVATSNSKSVNYNGASGTRIQGSKADYIFGIDVSDFDYSENERNYIVIDIDLPSGSEISVLPAYNGREGAALKDECESVNSDNGYVFEIKNNDNRTLTALLVEVKNAQSGVVLNEIYLCANKYSASWICENHLGEPAVNGVDISATLEGEKTAIRLVGMTQDDKTNSNGGMYHDFVNTK